MFSPITALLPDFTIRALWTGIYSLNCKMSMQCYQYTFTYFLSLCSFMQGLFNLQLTVGGHHQAWPIPLSPKTMKSVKSERKNKRKERKTNGCRSYLRYCSVIKKTRTIIIKSRSSCCPAQLCCRNCSVNWFLSKSNVFTIRIPQ